MRLRLSRSLCATVMSAILVTAALAAPEQVEFVACYNQIGAIGSPSTPSGTIDLLQMIKFEAHGPGSSDPDYQMIFQPDDSTVNTKYGVISSGAGPYFWVQVPKSFFDWILQINTQYHGVYVKYNYDRATDGSGTITLTSFRVGLPPASMARCTTPNPSGSPNGGAPDK